MFASPSSLSPDTRAALAISLDARLADLLDLGLAAKVAHWNAKGPLFASLHPLFDQLAGALVEHADTVAERVVTLGGRAHGTVRHVADSSRLPPYPADTTRDVEHVRALVTRYGAALDGLRTTRALAESHGDTLSHDLVVSVSSALEKDAWFLHATLGE